MDSISATRLASLVGDVARERPPLYTALAGRIRLLVGDGRLAVGVRLPAERDLAAAIGLSRATVTSAYGRLREDGWAAARQGSGTWTRLPAGPDPGAWMPGPVPAGVIDMAHAAPPAPPEVTAAFTAALADLPRFLPGHGYHPQGLPDLRARIADRYSLRGLPTTPEQVLVTAGALHAVTVALEVVCRRGDRVLVEHPSYPNVLDAISARGARRIPVAVNAADPDAVAADLHRAARQTGAKAAYVQVDFQNPTGMLLDEAQRSRLAVGLQQTDCIAVVDETLAELWLEQPTPTPFAAVARPDRVVTVGTMSKSFWGGLRTGWLRAEPDVIRRFMAVTARMQLSLPVLEQLASCHLLDAIDAVLPSHRARLREQRDHLATALRSQVPEWGVHVPSGGLVLWCQLPTDLSSSSLAAAGDAGGLRLAAGPRFGTGHAFDDRLRLPYTHPASVLEIAVARLAEIAADRRPRMEVADELVV
ncbi:MAG: PLP-dependent aminotransferase family protein [Candidatus Nanopelagicales bacterium]